MKDVSVIVLAAGSGSRFGEPKQFLELKPGVRLVDAALDSAFEITNNVVLVLPDGYDWDGRAVPSVVAGGESRLNSVAAGLSALREDQDTVVVHDAAHPLAPRQAFLDVIEAIRGGADAAVPILRVADVIKRIDAQGRLSTVGRDGLGLAQVPMGFALNGLLEAHARRATASQDAWEDAMLVEMSDGRVVSVPGSSRNVHVVTQEDLELARLYAAAEPYEVRTGSS